LRVAFLVIIGAILVAGAAGTSFWLNSYRDYEAGALKPLSAAGFLDLGEKYLLDLDYEQALVQFDLVITIEPRNPRGYTGAAEAYIGMGDIDSAIAILRQGLELLPDNAEIQAMLDELTKPSAPLYLEIHQIDSSTFPEITLYFTALDEQGDMVMGLDAEAFAIQEQGKTTDITAFREGGGHMPIAVSLIMDNSSSMDGNELARAKASAAQFLEYVDFGGGDTVEIIEFNSYVNVRLPYNSSKELLTDAIETMGCDGMTALYDALYYGLVRAYTQPGLKCVLAFTDGGENSSSRSIGDVIELANAAAIPIFTIGVGGSADEWAMREIAEQTGGKYYFAPTASDLEEIYVSVYSEQKDQYSLQYMSPNAAEQSEWNKVSLLYTDRDYEGSVEREYSPSFYSNLPEEFLYVSVSSEDYILPDSSVRLLTDSDLRGLTPEELRLARNEIYARHGRGFLDEGLQRHFDAKPWYQAIPKLPLGTEPILTSLEMANVNLIISYER
jgi:VWFA-related protein